MHELTGKSLVAGGGRVTLLVVRLLPLLLLVSCSVPGPDPGCSGGAPCIDGLAVLRLHLEGEEPIEDDDDSGEDEHGAFDEGAPIEGLEITELNHDNSVLSGPGGLFSLAPEDFSTTHLHARRTGYLDRVMIVAQGSYEAAGRLVEVDMAEAEHEAGLYGELFGAPYDPERGSLYVHFCGPDGENMAGARADIDVAYVANRVYSNVEEVLDSQVIPEFSPDPHVMFSHVDPGEVHITVTSPEGFDCEGPSPITVLPDAFTDALFTCLPR